MRRSAGAILPDVADARLIAVRLEASRRVPAHGSGSTVLPTFVGGTGVLSGEPDGGERLLAASAPGTGLPLIIAERRAGPASDVPAAATRCASARVT